MDENISFKEVGLKNGLIAGIGCIILTLILYVINIELVLGFWVWLGYGIIVALKVYTGYTLQKANDGVLEFKDGIKSIFPVSIVSLLVWIAFNGLLFTVFDPELTELSKEKAIERTVWVLEKSGADENTIESALEEVEQQDFTPSLKNSALNYAQSCIVGFLYTLVIAGFFHYSGKNNPIARETEA
ncbi:MAG: DUF4199 domain-containing protein [Chitinophagales bacterium]